VGSPDPTNLPTVRTLPVSTSSGFFKPTLHGLGAEDQLVARVPVAVKVERDRLANFHHDGRLHVISDICNHYG
jgi:hypothetical protein